MQLRKLKLSQNNGQAIIESQTVQNILKFFRRFFFTKSVQSWYIVLYEKYNQLVSETSASEMSISVSNEWIKQK